MQLKDVMTTDVEVVAPDSTVMEAAERMKRADVGLLPVCDGDQVVGMLSDRDITVRAVANGLDAATSSAPTRCTGSTTTRTSRKPRS